MAPPEAVPRRLQVPEGRYATVPGWLIDLETWAVHDLGAWPLATDDDRVVFRRDGRLVWRDLAAGEERDLGPAPGQRWPQRRAGALVQLAETLVDVRAGRRLDVRVTAEPLAVATDGRLLMPTNGWQHGVACGPIAWWPPEALEAFRPHRSCRDRIGGPMHLLPFPD